MATLDELIKARLEEKRQEREEAERGYQEELAEQKRQAALVSSLFAKRLENQYGLELASPYRVEANPCSNDGQFEARICLNHPSEYPMAVYVYPLVLHENEAQDRLETVKSDDLPWDGWRGDDDWSSFENLIDAVIYALDLEQEGN